MTGTPSTSSRPSSSPHPATPGDLIRLARPKQWAKSAFVLIGPAYGIASGEHAAGLGAALALAGIVLAFNFASSACYILNDLRDVESDRLHPRKRNRPIAAGRVTPGAARRWAVVLLVLAAASLVLVFMGNSREMLGSSGGAGPGGAAMGWMGKRGALLASAAVLAYIANVVCYTAYFKHRPVMDVLSLALGFVLRVLGGCAAVLIEPSSWLLNCTLFISMFLALGKRLGERRTMAVGQAGDGGGAIGVRAVQSSYTDDTLRMLVVMTAVACLLSYSDYVQAPRQIEAYTRGFNLLWLTLIPATYAIFRAVLLLERGVYDDPTELATRDRAFQAAVLVFVLITGVLVYLRIQGLLGVAVGVAASGVGHHQ